MTTAPARTPDDDLSVIESFASGDPYAPQRKRFAAWFGWRPSTRPPCPRTAAGKRCQSYAHGDRRASEASP